MLLWESKIHNSVHTTHSVGNAETAVYSNTCITLLARDKCQLNNVLRSGQSLFRLRFPEESFPITPDA